MSNSNVEAVFSASAGKQGPRRIQGIRPRNPRKPHESKKGLLSRWDGRKAWFVNFSEIYDARPTLSHNSVV